MAIVHTYIKECFVKIKKVKNYLLALFTLLYSVCIAQSTIKVLKNGDAISTQTIVNVTKTDEIQIEVTANTAVEKLAVSSCKQSVKKGQEQSVEQQQAKMINKNTTKYIKPVSFKNNISVFKFTVYQISDCPNKRFTVSIAGKTITFFLNR